MSLVKESSAQFLSQNKKSLATISTLNDLNRTDMMMSQMDFDKVQIITLKSVTDLYMKEKSNLKDEEQIKCLTKWCATKMMLSHRENSEIKKSMLIVVSGESDGYFVMVNTSMDPLNLYDHVPYLKITATDTLITLITKDNFRMYKRSKDDSLKYISQMKDKNGIMCFLEKPKLVVSFGNHCDCGHMEVFDLKTMSFKVFEAHKHKLVAICGDSNSGMIATASERGTVIRVFLASTGKLLCEFRSSYVGGAISALAISSDCGILAAVYSDGLVNLFKLLNLCELVADKSWSIATMGSLLSAYIPLSDYINQLPVSKSFNTEADVTAVQFFQETEHVILELVTKNERKIFYKINMRKGQIDSIDSVKVF